MNRAYANISGRNKPAIKMLNPLANKEIAIIGYGEVKNVRRSGRSTYDVAAEATSRVLEYTGLSTKDIDGMSTVLPSSEDGNNYSSNYLAGRSN